MANRAEGIAIEGLDEVIKMLDKLEIDDTQETRLLNKCKPIIEDIKSNQKVLTGRQLEGWKGSIKRLDGKKCFVIDNDDFTWIFENWGTSFAKHNIGYADRAVDSNIDKIAQEMIKEIEAML